MNSTKDKLKTWLEERNINPDTHNRKLTEKDKERIIEDYQNIIDYCQILPDSP